MEMQVNCAGIILSGGLNTRMGGRNKAFLEIGGRSFLDRILGRLTAFFPETLIVTREPHLYESWQDRARVIEDMLSVRSPLTGIHAGLVQMKRDFAFVTSCDTPLLRPEVITLLIEEISPETDVIAPAQGSHYQPMCAVYSRRCRPVIEEMLNAGERKVDLLFARIRLKTIPYERFLSGDPPLQSFFNVNTPEDLEAARRMVDRATPENQV